MRFKWILMIDRFVGRVPNTIEWSCIHATNAMMFNLPEVIEEHHWTELPEIDFYSCIRKYCMLGVRSHAEGLFI